MAIMTQQDMARILGIDPKTLRNWKKNKPELYKKVMQGFQLEQAVEEAKMHYEKLEKIADLDQK
jgi:transcriptional regulator with XRE-family HTH domain